MPTKRARAPRVPTKNDLRQPASLTYETNSYLQSVYLALHEDFQKYHGLIKEEMMVQARLELAEKTVCLTRDHLVLTVAQAECAAAPHEWEPLLNMIRFVG